MKKAIGLVVVMMLVAIMVGTYIKNQIESGKAISERAVSYEMDLNKEGLEKGQLAPDFTLQTLSGESLTLSEFKGKKVVLNFWATWCPPCKEEMPHLQEFYEEYGEEDNVEIIGLNFTYRDGSIEKVQQFVDSYDLTFPIALIEEAGVDQRYQVLTIPSTFMIDSNGRIQHHIVGPLDQKALREYVASLE
ncbi:TlpA family protein disulfide reductase [Lysinibacillus yapensis]|uniref:TlpA family protein disulfide reductase n=1 Tax=Ureibacillus yapensis TaxID=2304605 RepID=A0A396SFR9_9BACL|nr:TlpA disulfide reductase family protein [Lysinibacillus yapensis]RHW39892.1 TlpA family protein disulfide reductase [Lysinibacillus yapensis]